MLLGINVVMQAFDWDDAILLFFYNTGTNIWNLVITALSGWMTEPTENEVIKATWENVIKLVDNNDFKAFSIALLSIFFLWDVIEKLSKQAENITPFSVILYFVRLLFFSYLLDNLKTIIEDIMTFGKEVAIIINNAVPMGDAQISESAAQTIDVYLKYLDHLDMLTGFISTIFSIIYLVVMVSCTITVISEVIKLYQDLCFAIPLAPLAAGTMTNGGHWGQIAITYFKSLIGKALCFGAIVIMVAVSTSIANIVADIVLNVVFDYAGVEITFLKFIAILVMVQNVIKAMLISRSISGVENRIHQSLGL